MASDYASEYGYNPETWPDDWWLTDLQMSRDLLTPPVIFTEVYLKAHLAETIAFSVAAKLLLLCTVLPQKVASVFHLLNTAFSMYVEDFYTPPHQPGPPHEMLQTACTLSCLSHTLARRVHLFNESMSSLYPQIIHIGSSDPSNPSFLCLMNCLSNRCSALCRILARVEAYATHSRSLAVIGRTVAAARYQQHDEIDDDIIETMLRLASQYEEEEAGVEVEEDSSSSSMEVEDEENIVDDDDDGGGGGGGGGGDGHGGSGNHDSNDDNRYNMGDGDEVGGGHDLQCRW